MTMMTTIVAVALGLTPIGHDGTVKPISNDQARQIGRFTETTDDTGTTHLVGINRDTGEQFHLTVNPYGRVEGSVGNWAVTFQVSNAA
ncbi:hypothetical protein [Sphingomonas daechungensis]|uniref:hypothetical protein n=1 Tax=Sphingomonas daechungensis TaxID=1176646 RepID=UPI003782F5A9